ncbi:RNA-binding protein [Virgisporangium aliadipatigenens]|uniref:RNA-binding protein n=1 Tax=Virgisporangium aliadipatigenens TaxID=741659 RepID=A0A8J4DSH6_9ACTN|nr:TROVE domain-containing protein [Virgisporangium aliadipatigenens]GIJ47247.1 RNA-binding protein [Virgisporangium aliadipatigenens]
MAKFNRASTRTAPGLAPVVSERVPSGRTHEGGHGFARDLKSELFLLAVSNMVGEATFYEPAGGRDSRYVALVRRAAVGDPQWTAAFLRWLRGEANMRTAALVGAAEFVKARVEAGVSDPVVTNRKVVDSVLQRADEPGELLAYWTSHYGRRIPMPLKNGIADAVRRLYTERNLLKYDTATHAWRFADVIEIVHPRPVPGQSELFKVALERRHHRGAAPPAALEMLVRNAALRRRAAAEPAVLYDADALREAGMTWEDALSLAGPRLAKAKLWSAMIPSMGYMALLRNLRNFDEAGVPDDVASAAATRLADPAQVASSRQFPMRFLSAHRAAPSLRWGYPLERALGHSLANVPRLDGRTLVLVDTSYSMHNAFSMDGTLKRWDAAVIFGVALALRCATADVVSFASTRQTKVFGLRPAESLLASVARWKSGGYFIGGGTDTADAVRRHYDRHDRVVIVTDEQAAASPGGVSGALPSTVPLYTWNLAGYRMGHAPSGRYRYTFGGLTDQAFRMIPLLEAGRDAAWPW